MQRARTSTFALMTMVVFGFGAASPLAAASRRIVDLGTLPGHTSSLAHAINNDGLIVGESFDSDGNPHGFLWENGSMIDLGTLGGVFSQAEAINDRGQIVGNAQTAAGELHAFLWD